MDRRPEKVFMAHSLGIISQGTQLYSGNRYFIFVVCLEWIDKMISVFKSVVDTIKTSLVARGLGSL